MDVLSNHMTFKLLFLITKQSIVKQCKLYNSITMNAQQHIIKLKRISLFVYLK